jgi:site-specific recombinase XerD
MPYRVRPPGRGYARWYVRGTDAGGRFERSTGKENRRKAQTWADEFVAERARRRVPGAGADVGFRDAAEFYKAFKNPSKADIKLIDAVAEHFGDTNCRTFMQAHLVAAANALKPDCTDSTKNRKVFVPAAAVLHYAADQKWCEYRRFRKFRESRISNREPASDETIIKLLEHVEDPIEEMSPQGHAAGGVDPNLAYKRLLLVMLYELGLRITEYLNIFWKGGIDLPAARLRVRIPKTDKIAELELSPTIVAMLANLPDKEKTGRLMPWSTRRGVYAWLDRVQERAKVHYTPHQSRHAMATAAGQKRIPDAEAAKLGVWADARSLHRYQHVQPTPIPGRTAGEPLEQAAKKRKAG